MPEQDDKREGSARGDKSEDRRFWRAMAGEKSNEEASDVPAVAPADANPTKADPIADSVNEPVEKPVEEPVEKPVAHDIDDDGHDSIDLTPGDEQRLTPAERTARREALRTMLHRSEARHNNVRRKRRPVLTAGSQVRVASGPHVGEEGVILDADYIESRVLLALSGNRTPTWVSFEQVAGPRRKN